jgi:hypothetical protein
VIGRRTCASTAGSRAEVGSGSSFPAERMDAYPGGHAGAQWPTTDGAPAAAGLTVPADPRLWAAGQPVVEVELELIA